MSRTIISKVQSQQALSSKALKLLHLRGIQNFAVHRFQTSVALMRMIRITKTMRTMGINYRGSIFPLRSGLFLDSGEYVVLSS